MNTDKRTLNIGLFGFGCVGYGLYSVIGKTPGLKVNIKRICIRDESKERPVKLPLFTADKYKILDDPDIQVVVELIDDADAAWEITQLALRKGKAVVTANKKMLAEHMEEILELQKIHGRPVLYEGAVCASIPIIRNLEEYYDNDLLQKIEGIVNGSTNYILSKINKDNTTYLNALQEAQELGYAESNPLLDTGGFDAKYKLLILLAHAFGTIVKPEEILNIGIQNLGDLEIQFAREKGYKIKLIAQAYRNEDETVTAFVAPQFVKPHQQLYAVDDVYNGVIAESAFSENQFFYGRGAGAFPTASAVLSDISALTYQYKYEYKKMKQIHYPISTDVTLTLFVRFSQEHEKSIAGYFEKIEETYSNRNSQFIIGKMQLGKLKQLKETYPELSVIVAN
ncbi:MAG: homoserine dehydrogenase [Bacteroidetes bacterium]|nr:homoserine dehydrogenase [Bacteroidota bacterium]